MPGNPVPNPGVEIDTSGLGMNGGGTMIEVALFGAQICGTEAATAAGRGQLGQLAPTFVTQRSTKARLIKA